MGYNRVYFMKKIIFSVLCLMVSTFIFAQHTITINLTTDQYGSETSWAVYDVSGTSPVEIADGGPYTNVSQQQTIAPISVDGTGCYVFEIYDSYGDGMQAGFGYGSYAVFYDGVQVASGGDFGAVNTHHIGGDGCLSDEIALIDITSPSFCQLNNSLEISGYIGGYGTSTTSYDVTYKIDNGDWVTDHNVTCNIGMYQTHAFTHNIPATFTTAGTHTVTVKVHSPNGVTDDESDNVVEFEVNVYETAVERKVLMEHFSTAQCPNCPAATQNLTTWTNSRPNVIWVTHHVGYYTDQFTISESNTMTQFYNAGGSTYAPAIMLDRTHIQSTGEPGPVFFPSASITPNLLDERLATPAFVTLNMEGTLSEVGNYVNINITGEFITDINLGNLKLSVLVIENGLPGPQSGATTTPYIHNHVIRDMISATTGDAVFTSTTAGSTFSKSYTYKLNDNWNPDNCKIIAFVNNWDPSNVNNREVLNAEQIDVASLSVDINENDLDKLAIYPNPANNVVNVYAPGMEKVEILNAVGQVVYNSNMVNTDMQINIESLTEGIYFIRVSGAEGSRTQKLIKK